MSGKVDKILSKLEKINRLNREIVVCLIDDPWCLDAYPYLTSKKQAYQQAIAYFESKRIESKSNGPKTLNDRTTILLCLAIEEWKKGVCEKEYEAAAKITKLMLNTSAADLQLVPEDIKGTAFKIIKSYLIEIGGLNS